jgi:uncharacterized protein YprB with RNaseH-like and TPR domain
VSEDFQDRLRRLRKEQRAASSERVALPETLRARLAARARSSEGVEPAHQDPELASVGEPTGLAEARNAAGEFAARVQRFEPSFRHGARELREIDAADRDLWRVLTGDAAVGALDPRRAVYLDIETTGLSGGAGTKAFLVGLGRFDGERFELWQGFLRGPEEERAMLRECAERIEASAGIVSFFGKAFDRHRLEDKMRFHGIRPPFDERAHFDLYHPCRRLYAGVFVNSKLATLERELCGVERDRDLPGSFAPAAWYDFLAGRAHLLEQVFRHNRDDVLSLVTLAAHLGEVHRAGDPSGGLDTALVRREASRSAALAWLYARERRWSDCVDWSRRAAASAAGDDGLREMLELQSAALDACGRADEREELLERLARFAEDLQSARAAFGLATTFSRADSLDLLELAERCAERDPAARGSEAFLRRVRKSLARARTSAARRES